MEKSKLTKHSTFEDLKRSGSETKTDKIDKTGMEGFFKILQKAKKKSKKK